MERRRNISPTQKEKADELLFSKTVMSEEFLKADIVLCYYPIKNEVNVLRIAYRALECGKRIAFPVCNTKSHTLSFYFVDSIEEMKMGAYSIPEPSCDSESVENSDKCICMVPGLVFDRKGHRIGYGKGFYDRFLLDFKGFSVGLCYDDFLLDSIPKDENDVPVDILISDKEEIHFYEGKK